MNPKVNLSLAVAAGLLGGLLSSSLPSVFAQTRLAPSARASAPMEVRAQSFVLVDGGGREVGRFTFQPPSGPGQASVVVLLDPEGHEVWRSRASIHPLGQ
jgi:hypothetical protein